MAPVSSLDSVLDSIQLDVEDPFMLLTQSLVLGLSNGPDSPCPIPTPPPPHPLPQPQML